MTKTQKRSVAARLARRVAHIRVHEMMDATRSRRRLPVWFLAQTARREYRTAMAVAGF